MPVSKGISRGRPTAIAPALLLAALSSAVIFWRLGDTGLVNGDEGFYHAVARNMLAAGDFTRLEFTGEHRVYDTFMNAPLQYWARAGLIAVLGDNYWSMRILSALFAVLSVVATYWLAAGIGGVRAGMLAGLLLLTTFQFLFLHGARTGELEPIVCFVLLLTCLLFLRCIERDRGWIGHHLCLLALVNLKTPLVLIPLGAELVFLLLVRPAQRRLAGWLAWGAAIAPIALAWHIGQLLALGDEAWDVLTKMSGQASGEALQRERGPAVNAAFYARTMLFGAYPYVFVFPVAAVGLLAARMSRRRKRRVAHVALLAFTVLTFFLLVAKSYPWYVIPAYPFLCVLAGCWLARLTRDGVRGARLAGAAIVAGLCAGVWPTSVNPFSETAMKIDVSLSWRTWAGGSAALTALALVAIAMVATAAARRVERGVPAAWLLVCALLAIGGYRTYDGLRGVGFVSPTERAYRDLQAKRSAGEPLRFPIDLPQLGNTRVRYFFGDEYEIVRATGKPGVAYQLLGVGKTPYDPPRRPYQKRSMSPKKGREQHTDDHRTSGGKRRRKQSPQP